MKLICIAFLASTITSVHAQGAALEARWTLDAPTISYIEADNVFNLVFASASYDNVPVTGMKAEFYDRNCQDDGSAGFVETLITDGLSDPVSGLVPAMAGGSGNEVKLNFKIATETLANNAFVYDVVDAAMVAEVDSIFTDADIGMGVMRMCVRTEIGYMAGPDFQDVNYVESLITIKYLLTAGFQVAAFAVEPKIRIAITEVKDTYALEAWLCLPTDTETVTDGDLVRTLPKRITAYAPDSDGNKVDQAFNQGALITVCVAPDVATANDGIVLAGLTTFTWTKATGNIAGSIMPSQVAIPVANGFALTSYVEADCVQAVFCHFSSILFADFYVAAGTVAGAGTADLAFKVSRRRLGAVAGIEEGRQLQEAAASSPFDVSVVLDVTADGPGAIKTAGGASYGFSALASAVALLSAALLA